MKKIIIILFLLLSGIKNSIAQSSSINWQQFMAKNDMVFDTLTTKWEDGAFMGNGLIGGMVFMENSNSLRFEIGRTDVVDHHKEKINELIGKCRLPIGYFVLHPVGRILSNTVRVDLWNAELRGLITTTKGTIQWQALTLSQTNVIILKTQYSGNEKSFNWNWVPEESVSTRISFPKQTAPPGYKANPPGALHVKNSTDKIFYYHQPISAGGSYTTAWQSADSLGKRNFYISIGYSQQDNTSDNEAITNIENASAQNITSLINVHRLWWHQFYQQSFITMPDALLESFYWIQQYKIASASRQNKPLIDLMGPWFKPTPWPVYWWNLNAELTYSSLYTANHLEIASVLPATIDKNISNLINNAPEQYQYNALALGRAGGIGMNAIISVTDDTSGRYKPASEMELGNATWMLYYYWLQYRYSLDNKVLADLFPILKRSINYYLDILHKETDGKYHLPYTASPEYPGGITRDCNYDLSLLRWGCTTLLKMNDSLRANDKLATKWKDVLKNLTPYPVNKNGLMIGKDVPFAVSHRHYSHLLMIYPLHLLNWDQIDNRSLIEKSLLHWHSMPKAMQGYSWTGGGSIYATMGRGDKARDYLDTLLTKFIKPNTMYLESGPVIETPLAAATTIQELFLQYWNDKIRVFPAMPYDWKDASFKDLRTEGAFLLSGVRKDGITKWVSVKSLQGGLCQILPNLNGLVKISSAQPVKMIDKGNGEYEMMLKKGQEVFLFTNENALNTPISETSQIIGKSNYWGKKIKPLL